MPTYHEVPVAHTSTQIVARRSAAPVLAVAPSNTKALRPSSIAAPRRGRPRGTGTGRRARVVPRRACGPPQTPRARAHLGAGQRSPRRRCTPTARKPAPTISHKPVVPRRPRPPASRMTRGPPRSAPCRIEVVLSARSKSQGRQPNSSSPSPATCRESWGRGAATPRRYDPSSASPAFGAVLRRAAAVPSADFAARRRSIFLAVGPGGATAPEPPLGRQSGPRPPSAARDSTRA